MTQKFVIPKVDWPHGHCFNVAIGDIGFQQLVDHFKPGPGESIFKVEPGSTWTQLLSCLGLIGERGVFPSESKAQEAGWEGEITCGAHERPLNCRKNYCIRVLRKDTLDNEK